MKEIEIDELVARKMYELINYVLSKIIKPDMKIENVTELDEEKISEIKRVYGIEGIILDVDETLRKDMRDIPECNKEWIKTLKGQLKIIVLSNGYDDKIQDYFEKNGIDYIRFAHKPFNSNILKACNKMRLDPTKVMMVGDRVWEDVYGGNKNKIYTILVKNVEEDER